MRSSLALFLLLLASNAAAKTISFETAVPPDSEMASELTTAFTQIFAKKGWTFVPIEFPSKRGLEELKSGRVDGTMGRFGNLNENQQTKNLLRVDHPLVFLTISMWCHKKLESRKARILLGMRLGNTMMSLLESTLDRNRISSIELNTYVSALQMLRTGRLDCMLGNTELMATSGVELRDLDEFKRTDLITAASYPWIAQQHAELKEFLEKELRAFPFSEAWRKKFRPEKSACHGSYDVLCPDGIVFTRKVDFKIPRP